MGAIAKLLDNIPENVDAALIVSDANRFYFTGFRSSLGYLFISRDYSALLVDSRYYEAAKNTVTACEVLKFSKFDESIKNLINKTKIKNIAIENQGLSFAAAKDLIDKISKLNVKVITSDVLDKAILSLRSIKSEKELANLIKSQKLTDLGFEHILKFIKPGVTEIEVALELEFFLRKNGAEAVSFDFIAVSGKNSSLPHGVPTTKKIEYGDFITLDFGCMYNGYASDMTRTVAVGGFTKEMEKIYNIVLQAQTKAIESIENGVSCQKVDAAARDIIKLAGYGEYFGHGVGHCLGIEVHEKPYCSASSDTILKTNMVTTIEPGIYIPNKFGVRIEDVVIVQDSGCINITNSPKELILV